MTAIPEFRPDDPSYFLQERNEVYRQLREESPVHWYQPGEFWVLSKYADVRRVSSDPATFCSRKGFRINDDIRTGQGLPGIPPSMLGMDPPQHTQYRKLVNQYFTHRQVAKLEPRIREFAREALDTISPGETCDFVDAVSAPLPVLVIADLMGIPTSERERFKVWSDDCIAANEGDTEAQGRVAELFSYVIAQAMERRSSPRDDLISIAANARLDGQLLTEAELGIFGVSLLVAGNETTRNLISGAARALMQHPEQREKLVRDPSLIENAVEEMLRWVSPVRCFARTATRDVEIREQPIAKDDFLVLCYGAANRDEDAYGPTSESFDVTRRPTRPHLAFGFGQHICLGAHLARLEARVMFEELLARFPHFELAGESRRVPSTLINGIESMPVTFRA